MHGAEISYENVDTSRHAFPLESPYFPAFLRLLRWKILDICIRSTDNSELGEFARFEPLFLPGELNKLVRIIKDETLPPDPFKEKIEKANIDDKMKRQAEAYAKYRNTHEFRVRRRRFVEYFFTKTLFNEQGIRIADEIIYNSNVTVYTYMHLDMLKSDWIAARTFKERFFKQEELDADPYSMQMLDKVVGSSRGNLFLKGMNGDQRCDNETPYIENQLKDAHFQIHSSVVKSVLDEGPHYLLERNEEGDEVKGGAVTWTEHLTRLIFFSFPQFDERSKRPDEQEDWYYGLLEAMKDDPHNRAALFFLNRNYQEELDEIDLRRQRDRLAIMKSKENVDEIVHEVITTIRPQAKDSGYFTDADVSELILRSYQTELVQPALDGKNVVIVAPTGSGKTEVAIYAALNHIKEREAQKRPARVVMVVPKIPLVGQQKERFLKYCRGKYHVEGFHGSEKSSDGKGRCEDVIQAHVCIMTPQILVNMWQSVRQSERLFVSDFSMIIFDEVHKASGDHPYVEISRMIQDWEHEKPQIIGLTASLNINVNQNNAQNERMYDSIYEMLAILNAPNLSAITKQENIDELNEHVGKPDDSVELCRKDSDDEVVRGFINKMLLSYTDRLKKELDILTKGRSNCFSPGTLANFAKANIKYYEQYEAYLQNVIQDLNRLNMEEKMISLLYAKYIKAYVEARGIVEIMPPRVALDFMMEVIGKLDEQHTLSDQLNEFRKNKETLRNELNKEGNEEQKYPDIVKKLKATLIGQFQANPDSRCIIFVTQRSTAKRVSDFLNDSGIMEQFHRTGDELKASAYVLGTNHQGLVQQNQQEQAANIEKFNHGRLKIMVATSVVEEGLDVAACNLIIKYNCSSGSAIQLVQQRGRARAKNSRSVLLSVSNSVNEKENNALISEKFMKLCVSKIMKFTPSELIGNVNRVKAQLEKELERKAKEKESLRSKLNQKYYKVACSSCNRVYCRSSDIKKIYSNYMVMDPTVWDHFIVQRKTKVNKYLSEETQPLSILHCFACKTAVGKAYKMRGVYLPQLDVNQCTFRLESASKDEQSETRKKWRAVEEELFFIPMPVQKDFENMLSALSGSESNMKKKQILDFDSQQHIKDVDKFRNERARREQEAQRKLKMNPKSTFPIRKTNVSDDEEENKKKEDEEGGEEEKKKTNEDGKKGQDDN